MVDELTKKQLGSIPLLKTKAGPRDGELWVQRLKEEYQALIQVSCITSPIRSLRFCTELKFPYVDTLRVVYLLT